MFNPFLDTLDFGDDLSKGRPSPSFDMGGGQPAPGDLPGMDNPMPMAPPRNLFMGGKFVDPGSFSQPGQAHAGTGNPYDGTGIIGFEPRPQNFGEATDGPAQGGGGPMPVAPRGWRGGNTGIVPPGTGGFMGGPRTRGVGRPGGVPPGTGGFNFQGIPLQFQQLMQHPLFARMLQSFQQNPQNQAPQRRDAGAGLGAGQPGIDWVRR